MKIDNLEKGRVLCLQGFGDLYEVLEDPRQYNDGRTGEEYIMVRLKKCAKRP
jgi:hypothetical protein